jgi:hypothetical protein
VNETSVDCKSFEVRSGPNSGEGGPIYLVVVEQGSTMHSQAHVHQVENLHWVFLCLSLVCLYPCVLVHALPAQILTLRNWRGFVLWMNWPHCLFVSSARQHHAAACTQFDRKKSTIGCRWLSRSPKF